MIRALKQAHVPVAGADRLDLLAHIAVMGPDRCRTRSLAPTGRPYARCRPEVRRSSASTMTTCCASRRTEEARSSRRLVIPARPRIKPSMERLRVGARGQRGPLSTSTRVCSPKMAGRRAMEARLGPEACDAMDEFLRLALRAEKDGTRSLLAFPRRNRKPRTFDQARHGIRR